MQFEQCRKRVFDQGFRPIAYPKIPVQFAIVRVFTQVRQVPYMHLRFRKLFRILTICLLAVPAIAAAQQASTKLSTPAIEAKVNALLNKMTLEEKVGQLVQYSAGAATGPGSGRTDDADMIAKGQVGSLFNATGAKTVNDLQRVAVEKSRLHIPLIFGLDVIHGYRTTFPIPLGLASTWDPDIVEKAARVAAKESAAGGVRWTFSPMVDIARDARWGRMAEGAGEDPFLGSVMARAYVWGYQGKDLSAADSIVACAKHYVGYGAAEGGRDYNSVEISEHTLRQYYLPPFHAAQQAGAGTFMSAFNSLNGVPTSANPFTLKQVLRKEWGFQGFVVSDWGSIRELIAHGIANDGKTAARKAFQAGVDMDMVSNLYHENIANLVKEGKISQADLDDSVRRILRVKFAMGLFDHPYADETAEANAMLQPASLEVARHAAERSFVLLKNDKGTNGQAVLPISANVSSVALIGPLGDDAGNMLGSWAGLGHPEDAVTLRAALSKKLGADKVRFAKGGSIAASSEQDIAEAVTTANSADLVVLALGEDAPEMTGEAASRAHPGLPGQQQQLLEKVIATGKPVALVLFSGRPLMLPWTFAHVPSVLAVWFPGVQAGPAIANILFGETVPSGKLVVSWPRAVGQEPLYYNALNTGRPAADPTHPPNSGGDKYSSRYIDEQNAPQFPFGFGLSYTKFNYGATQLSSNSLKANDLRMALRAASNKAGLTATADVTNSGSQAAEEVVQLYVRLEGTSTAQPVRALKGFERVSLAPGETKKVSFTLGPDAFAFYDINNSYTVEPAHVTVWISPDSAQGTGVTLELQ